MNSHWISFTGLAGYPNSCPRVQESKTGKEKTMIGFTAVEAEEEFGELSILNVGRGDVNIQFNRKDQGDIARAKLMIEDMMKRGYTLLVKQGDKYSVVQKFDPKKEVYIVVNVATESQGEGLPIRGKGRKGRLKTEEIPMAKAKAVGIGRSAGG